ncbi:hypothetical protein [Tenacibaculum sp. Ill]|uniref:hypothetical protein n=1 Tax=Tenacibaculum sp. Ill TaxID=3445935 RepID=UPI003F7A8E96
MKKRKKQIAKFLKLGVFLFGVSLLLWNCEKQEEVNHGLENEHFGIPQKYFKKKITLKEVLSNEELYNVLEKNFIRSGEQKKVNEFIPYNYILKVYTSQGILFYNDTIKTYTFPIITNLEKEEHSFFNLLLQEYKGKLYVGVIKYIPSSNWLSNKNEKYEGSFELIDKEGRSKKSYASKSSCETILKAFYAPCGCGGSANGHAPSGAWCCKGSPLLGYDMEFSCSGGGSNGEPGDLDGVSGGLDSGGSSGSAQTDPTEAIYTDTALGINKSLGGTLSDSELEWIDTHPLESFKIVNFIIANEDENKQLISETKTFAEQAIKLDMILDNNLEVKTTGKHPNEISDCCPGDCCPNPTIYDNDLIIQEYGIKPVQAAVDATFNGLAFVTGVVGSKEWVGKRARRIMTEIGMTVPSDITNEHLAELYQIRKKDGLIIVEYRAGLLKSMLNFGLDTLDILSFLSPSKGGGAFLATKMGGNITTTKLTQHLRDISVTTTKVDNVVNSLKSSAKFDLIGTGKHSIVKGHHPLAKSAFRSDKFYDIQKAFSVSSSKLQDIWRAANPSADLINIHNKITGQQNSLYSAFAKTGEVLTLDKMAEIEIKAMTNVGVPKDVATGWVIKALEDLKAQGVKVITNIPWNGIN